jgi:hypothetical protein
MDSNTKSYNTKHAQLIKMIDDAEEEMITLYRAHIKKLLTDTESGVFCMDVETEEIETIRTRNYGEVFEGEDCMMSHELTFNISLYEVVIKLTYANYDEGCGSCSFFGAAHITMRKPGSFIEFDSSGSEWFMSPDRYSDRKKEQKALLGELSTTFGEDVEPVASCIKSIISQARHFKW